jgi:hypothetical protein
MALNAEETPSAPTGLKALKPRHKLIALMRASGRSNAAIASELGMSAVGVGLILKSPLMRALVDQYLREIESRTATNVADVIATLRGETAKTLTTMLEIRDTGTREDSTRLAATIELLDRQIPKVHRTDESKTVRIVLDGARLDRLAEISREGVALPPAAVDADIIPPRAPVRVGTLDDVLERLRAEEAAAEDDADA